MAGRPGRALAPAMLGAVVIISALWPLTAYAVSPVLLPAAIAAAGAIAVAVTRPEYGIAITLAITPIAGMEVAGSRPFLPALPALALGLFVYGAILRTDLQRTRFPGFAVAVLIFTGSSILSASLALDSSKSTSDIFWLLIAVVLMLAVLQICRERNQLLAVAYGAVAGLLLAGLHGLFQQATGEFSSVSFAVDGAQVGRIAGAFGHPNQYAGFLALFCPLAGSILISPVFPAAARLLSAAALACALPALSFSYTRGAVLGLALGTLIWVAVVRPRAAVAVAMVVAIAMGFLAPAALRERFQSDSRGDVTLRADIWRSAGDIYATRPFVGVGVNNFGEAYENLGIASRSSRRRLLHTQEVIVPPHAQNLYLNVLAEQGLLGLVTLLLLMGTGVIATYRGSRARDPAARMVSIGAGAGLLALAIQSQLDVNLFGERTELPLFALLVTVAAFVWHDRRVAPAG